MSSKAVHIKIILIVTVLTNILLTSCNSGSEGSDEDSTPGVVSLTNLNSGEEVVGTYSITWTNNESNRSTVDINLSTDSAASYSLPVAINVPDTGSYSWDSNTSPDCRKCRISISATDIVGNVSTPVESAMDFIVNNVPQVLGTAIYYDVGNDGPGDLDTIVVPFDKTLELTTGIASDIFVFPVLGDDIGSFAEVKKDPADASKLIITMNGVVPGPNNHLHVNGSFKLNKLSRTSPSGLNLRDDIGAGVIFARDTNRTAEVAENGVDVAPAFTDSGQTFGATFTFSTVLGDIDGDGDLDMVTGNVGQPNRVWRNNGGIFSEDMPAQTLGAYQTHAVALGDIDGDGDLDLVSGNFGINRVWNNNDPGNPGVFTDSTQTLGTNQTSSVALGDIDGDGDLDMVTGNFTQPNRVWLNGGDNTGSNTGLFSENTIPQTLGNNPTQAIALGDVDGDGDLDLVTANKKQPSLVWLNGGDNSGSNTGVFSDSGQVLDTPSSEGSDIILGDVDGDGDLDMVVGMVGNSRLWINNINNMPGQEGEFTDSGQKLGIGFTNGVSFGDLDNDGDLDLILGRSVEFAGSPNRVLVNNINNTVGQEGVFTDSGQVLGNDSTISVTLGDIDGDGDLDMVTGNVGQSNRLWLNSLKSPTSGLLVDSGQSLETGFTNDIALGDIDGDGDLDMVTGNTSGSGVWINNFYNLVGQEGVYTDSGQDLDTGGVSAIALGDIDNDGDLDIVTGGSGANSVWLNGGDNSGSNTGIFTDSLQTLGSYSTSKIVLGDIDGDGDLDLVTANGFPQDNRVWRNTGGLFAEDVPAQLLGTVSTRAIALGDIDGDGDLDVVLGRDQQPDSIWLNGGDNSGSNTGIFSDSGQTLGMYRTGDIALGDIDGDGDLDMVTANNYSSENRVWRNDAGVLDNDITPAPMLAIADSSTANALGDFDNDGDLDMIVVNQGQANRLWINNKFNLPGLVGVFSDSGLLMDASFNTTAVAVGDIDGDGDLDVVTSNFIGNGRVWLNDF